MLRKELKFKINTIEKRVYHVVMYVLFISLARFYRYFNSFIKILSNKYV